MSDEIKLPSTFKLTEQHSTLQQFYDFHPEAFEELSDDEMKLLGDVYFINRDEKGKNIRDYLRKQFDDNPELPNKLQPVLEKIAQNIKLREDAKDFFLFNEEELKS